MSHPYVSVLCWESQPLAMQGVTECHTLRRTSRITPTSPIPGQIRLNSVCVTSPQHSHGHFCSSIGIASCRSGSRNIVYDLQQHSEAPEPRGCCHLRFRCAHRYGTSPPWIQQTIPAILTGCSWHARQVRGLSYILHLLNITLVVPASVRQICSTIVTIHHGAGGLNKTLHGVRGHMDSCPTL